MTKTISAVLLGALLIMTSGCVGARVYKKEKTARVAAEAREKVLNQELADRKKETLQLTRSVGDLNRTLGRQDKELEELRTELVARTRSMGESASKLSTENTALEKELATTNELLEQRNDALARIRAVREKRASILNDLAGALGKSFEKFRDTTITVAIDDESVALTLPDKLLFESNGISVSLVGKNLVSVLSEMLLARPALAVRVEAYTDNVLPPKEKNLKDTWEWSLQRATTLVQMLIREFNVNANQLTPVGKGEFYPAASNATPEGRAKNRRTVFVIQPPLPAIPRE